MQIVLEPKLLDLELDKLDFHILNYLSHPEYREFYQTFIINVKFIKLLFESYKNIKFNLEKNLKRYEYNLIEQSIFIKMINIIKDEVILQNQFTINFSTIEMLVEQSINHELKEKNSPLVNHEKIIFEYKNINIIELQSTFELQSIGEKMHHCVGSYTNAVKNEQSVIFQIEHNSQSKFKYTCEINPKNLNIVQIRGVSNQSVKTEHQKVISEIIKMIKEKLKHRYNLKNINPNSELDSKEMPMPLRQPALQPFDNFYELEDLF